jgi:hypothetical protein
MVGNKVVNEGLMNKYEKEKKNKHAVDVVQIISRQNIGEFSK